MGHPKSNRTTFRRGRQKTGGRRLGTPNRNTKILREAVLLAAEAAGSAGGGDGLFRYLKKIAQKKPAIFVPLLARLLPLQVESQQSSKMDVTYRSSAEIRQELIRRGVPIDQIVSEPISSDEKETKPKECNITDCESNQDKEETSSAGHKKKGVRQ